MVAAKKSIVPGMMLVFHGTIHDSYYVVMSVDNCSSLTATNCDPFVSLFYLYKQSIRRVRLSTIRNLKDWQLV